MSADDRGRLTTSGFSTAPDGGSQVWEPIGPGLFREKDSGERLAFIEDDAGAVTMAATSYNFYSFVLVRLAWHDSMTLHLAAAGGGLLLMLSMLIWPAIGAVRLVRRTSSPTARGTRAARWTAAAAAVLVVASVIGALSPLLIGQAVPGGALFAAVPASAALAAVGTAGCAVLGWGRGWWTRTGRVHFTAVCLGLIVFLCVCHRYGLLGLTG